MEESSSNQEDFINNRDEMKIQSTEEREEGYDSDPNSENNAIANPVGCRRVGVNRPRRIQ